MAALTEDNHERHLDRFNFGFGNESPAAGAPAVVALQGNLAAPRLRQGNCNIST